MNFSKPACRFNIRSTGARERQTRTLQSDEHRGTVWHRRIPCEAGASTVKPGREKCQAPLTQPFAARPQP